MIRHLRANTGAIVVAMLIFTVIPLAVERWHILRDHRIAQSTLHEMQFGSIDPFFRVDGGMNATDASESNDLISHTTFTRFSWRETAADQVLRLSCIYQGGRRIDLRTRQPINLRIEEGLRTINISYSLHDFGVDELASRGLDPRKCDYYFTKEWTLHLASGIDRVYELKSNTFRIVD
jgi:hypothetical protein